MIWIPKYHLLMKLFVVTTFFWGIVYVIRVKELATVKPWFSFFDRGLYRHFSNKSPFFKVSHKYSCQKIFDSDHDELERARSIYNETSFNVADEAWNSELQNNKCGFLQQFYWPTYSHSKSVACVITMNEELNQLVLQLHALYAANNVFCIHVDLKARKEIHDSVAAIAKCINSLGHSSQVVLPQNPVSVIYRALGNAVARKICLELLLKSNQDWENAVSLESHDFPLRTQSEISLVLRAMGGNNVMNMEKEFLHTPYEKNTYFVKGHLEYYVNLLGVVEYFKAMNGSECLNTPVPHGLKVAKAIQQAVLARAFVEFALRSHATSDL